MTANEVAEATGIAKRASTDRESRMIEGGIAEQGRETGSNFAKRESLSRSARDDSPEARADRLAAGVATVRLTQELCALHDLAPRPGFPDLRPECFYQPGAGPRIPVTCSEDWFRPGSEARMSEVERQRWLTAWVTYGKTCAERWDWQAEQDGRARPLLVAADDSTPF